MILTTWFPFALRSLLFTFWGVFACNFVNFETNLADDYTTAIGLFWRTASYLSYTVDDYVLVFGSCTPYNWWVAEAVFSLDGKFRAAIAFGLIAVICGFIMAIVVWIIAPCVPIPKNGWRTIGVILAVIGLSQLLTLLILSSKACSSRCTNLALGGILSIVSGVLWLVSALLCCFVGEPVGDEHGPYPAGTPAHESPSHLELSPVTQNQQVVEKTTTQQHVEEDGTIVIETTTTRADGGITVTTEVIPPGTAVGSVNEDKM
ncbi:hypothetical protein ACHAXM_002354 [Skeletonema potamos]